jgi:hypothetical protein
MLHIVVLYVLIVFVELKHTSQVEVIDSAEKHILILVLSCVFRSSLAIFICLCYFNVNYDNRVLTNVPKSVTLYLHFG